MTKNKDVPRYGPRNPPTIADLGAILKECMPTLQPFEEQYKDFHSHPELGKQESRTASIAARHLSSLKYDHVFSGVGGHGVVGVLKNGSGNSVLLRADMDALPLKEETGLPYASKVHQIDSRGEKVPVSHACGHDMHVTTLMAVATVLQKARSRWAGTLICLFQPNEEGGAGAQAMVDDGLYDLISPPDVILGQHVDFHRSGDFNIRAGPTMATADSYHVTIHGKGGHGSTPDACIDPVVIASYIVVRLQSIVSRVVSPLDTAVVTVGAIHGGQAENIIPNEVVLKLNLRTYSHTTREKVNKAVHDIIKSECESAGAPKEPTIERISRFPLTDNDPHLAKQITTSLSDFFGADRVTHMEKLPGSEDFSNLALPNKTPYVFWFFGGTDHNLYDRLEREGRLDQLPKNHMSHFAPVIEPTLQSAVQSLALGALTFLAA